MRTPSARMKHMTKLIMMTEACTRIRQCGFVKYFGTVIAILIIWIISGARYADLARSFVHHIYVYQYPFHLNGSIYICNYFAYTVGTFFVYVFFVSVKYELEPYVHDSIKGRIKFFPIGAQASLKQHTLRWIFEVVNMARHPQLPIVDTQYFKHRGIYLFFLRFLESAGLTAKDTIYNVYDTIYLK